VSDYGFRAATPADAERITAVTMEGFGTYLAFAPDGWTPPSPADERARLLGMLDEEHVWYRVAEHKGEIVGHVGFLPADHTFAPTGDPRLAHFRQLFVVRAHWGTGLATRLHSLAIAEARARGFTGMRLFTPAAQERARRFYEREGWALARPPAFDDRLGLDIAEYRRAL
jgi:GNAT superfamily N-acetyltransferase